MKLAGKVAIVTGGGAGSEGPSLERSPASVAVNYTQNADAAERVVAGIRADGGRMDFLSHA